LPAQTADGVDLLLTANIEFPHEVGACLQRGAAGIGLYRTEFLYLGADVEPTEEDHYRAYLEVVQAMGGRPVVIRTMDLGADKLGQLPQDRDEHNPCLGLRSIRFSLQNLPIFRTQLRAILRASAEGNVHVMFPLITTLLELRQARMLLNNVMEDLQEEGIPFRKRIPVGMMVEVPAAVTMIDVFIKEIDFISIGTNDLIQYALAVDRSNKDVSHLYQACDPAVLRLIDTTLKAARQADVPANICGQMSGTPHFALLLLGMGLRSLSVPPSSIPEIKQLCRNVKMSQCEAIAARVMRMEGAREIDTYLKQELKKLMPRKG
jgi:phosphotransferase system enzyme I (PtsI)